MSRIICVEGEYKGAKFDIKPGETIVIGRDAKRSQIVLSDNHISHTHCAITMDKSGRECMIQCLSKNGVSHIDKDLHKRTKINYGQSIRINNGDTISMYQDSEQFILILDSIADINSYPKINNILTGEVGIDTTRKYTAASNYQSMAMEKNNDSINYDYSNNTIMVSKKENMISYIICTLLIVALIFVCIITFGKDASNSKSNDNVVTNGSKSNKKSDDISDDITDSKTIEKNTTKITTTEKKTTETNIVEDSLAWKEIAHTYGLLLGEYVDVKIIIENNGKVCFSYKLLEWDYDLNDYKSEIKCYYYGEFSEPIKVDDYTYKVILEKIYNLDYSNHTEGKVTYTTDIPSSIDFKVGDEFIVWLPGTSLSTIPGDISADYQISESKSALSEAMIYNKENNFFLIQY